MFTYHMILIDFKITMEARRILVQMYKKTSSVLILKHTFFKLHKNLSYFSMITFLYTFTNNVV